MKQRPITGPGTESMDSYSEMSYDIQTINMDRYWWFYCFIIL